VWRSMETQAGRHAYPADAWVEVSPPAPHALLISASVTMARNLSPTADAKRLDEVDELSIFLSRPLVPADRRVDFMPPALCTLLPSAPVNVLCNLAPLVSNLALLAHARVQGIQHGRGCRWLCACE
jgi:hypothetical protein